MPIKKSSLPLLDFPKVTYFVSVLLNGKEFTGLPRPKKNSYDRYCKTWDVGWNIQTAFKVMKEKQAEYPTGKVIIIKQTYQWEILENDC